MDAVVVCNPIMHHLYLGFDPVELRQSPFTAATSSTVYVDAADIDLSIHPRAKSICCLQSRAMWRLMARLCF
jgi:uncharacterized 2Fe-2S/4Fe-4S cluster protein (DUF4445 family)